MRVLHSVSTVLTGEDVRNAVAQVYATQRLPMVRLATFLCGDREVAEEIVQEAFLGLLRRWSALAGPEAAVGYLRASVVNGTRNLHRHRRVARRHLHIAEPDVAPAADDALLLAEEHRAVLAALDRLPQRQREVLVLRYWSELGEAEIANALGVPRGTVKSTASRALDALERLVKDAP
jgi:RNA polymerase sigma-70 factor (sigma-E family)